MRPLIVLPLAAVVVLAGTGPALAEPPSPALPPLPAALDAQLSPAESSTLAQLTAGAGVGLDAVVRSPDGGAAVVALDAGTAADATRAVSLLDAQPGVTAGLTTRMHIQSTSDHPSGVVSAQGSYYQWDMPHIAATAGRSEAGAGLSSVTVAVLDTGIAANPKLTPTLVPGRNFSGSNAANPSDTTDRHWHGTHVAGTIGAAADQYGVEGVAAGVHLMPVKVLDDDGSGSSSAVAQGLIWAADHGVDVVNMSLGGPDDPAMDAAVNYAVGKGVVVVAAAGNSAQNGNPPEYPASSPGVIAVGATDRNDAWGSFSRYGAEVALTAPGVDIASTYLTGGVVTASGTSMAAPHVAAVAALVKAVSRSLTPAQVRTAMTSTARDLGTAGRDDYYGSGLVDALGAVRAAYAASGQTAPANHPPVAADRSVTVSASGATVVDAKASAADADGDELWYSTVGPAASGSAVLTGDQRIRYTPASGGTTDSFTYTVTDMRGGSATATVHVAVGSPTGPPAPAGLTATAATGSIALVWSASSGASSYRVYRGSSQLDAVPTTGYTDPDVVTGSSYTYRVSAVDGAGNEGPISAPVSTTAVGPTAIEQVYARYGGAATFGAVTAAEHVVAGGIQADYVNGSIVQRDGMPAYAVLFDVAAKWRATGGVTGPLRFPEGDTVCGLAQNGCGQAFEVGYVFWAAATGAHVVSDTFDEAWGRFDWEEGALGYPTMDTVCGLPGGGCGQHFSGGAIFFLPSTGAHVVMGSFRTKWGALGWQDGQLGYPTTDTICGLPGGGCGQHFTAGALFSSPSTGLHAVVGPTFRDKWGQYGWQDGALGYPTTDTICGLVNGGCGQYFTRGAVFSQNGMLVPGPYGSDVHAIVGTGFLAKWGQYGWQDGLMGYPTTDTVCGLPGGGCGQQFSGRYPSGAAIFSSPATGLHAVVGPVWNKWGETGWQDGSLGYPVTDTIGGLRGGGMAQGFQRGNVYWYSGSYAWVVQAPFLQAWGATGYENGRFGYPTSPAYGLGTPGTPYYTLTQNFQGGSMFWSSNGRMTYQYS